jgi:hypothetical protein
MKLLLGLLFATALLFAQQQTKIAPDCTLGNLSFSGVANSNSFDNRPASSNTGIPCTLWTLDWSAQASVTSVTMEIEGAPDTAGAPGTFVVLASGATFPSGKVNFSSSTAYYPWMRVRVNAAGGTGNISATLSGWRDNAGSIGGGGGGGSGCPGTTGTPCVVVGPTAIGSPPTNAPVQIAGVDGSDNIITPTFCNLSAPISLSASGLTQLVALSAGKQIRICNISISFASAVGFQLQQGTGTACATGTGNVTGIYASILTIALDFTSGTLNAAASDALCANVSTAVTGGGVVNYAQY